MDEVVCVSSVEPNPTDGTKQQPNGPAGGDVRRAALATGGWRLQA
jgi:hypothetical protein